MSDPNETIRNLADLDELLERIANFSRSNGVIASGDFTDRAAAFENLAGLYSFPGRGNAPDPELAAQYRIAAGLYYTSAQLARLAEHFEETDGKK